MVSKLIAHSCWFLDSIIDDMAPVLGRIKEWPAAWSSAIRVQCQVYAELPGYRIASGKRCREARRASLETKFRGDKMTKWLSLLEYHGSNSWCCLGSVYIKVFRDHWLDML